MRALILVVGMALAVAACSDKADPIDQVPTNTADANTTVVDSNSACGTVVSQNDPDKGLVHCN